MDFIGRNLSGPSASLVDAICFNQRAMLDPLTKEEMANSGAVHIVSSAGIQVIVFGLLITLCFRFLPISRSTQIFMLAGVLGVYALATGLQPQVIRTIVVTLLGMCAYLFRRDSDALSALCLAGTCYLLWRPEAVFAMGFQFSFITAGFVALFYNRSRITPKTLKGAFIRSAKEFVNLMSVILLATTPLIAYYLGVVSVTSLFANILLCGCVPVMVTVAFMGHALSFLVPALGDAIATHLLTPIAGWVSTTIGWLGDGTGRVDVPAFSAFWLVAFYGAWLMTYRRRVVQP